jgi:hypothetical protein
MSKRPNLDYQTSPAEPQRRKVLYVAVVIFAAGAIFAAGKLLEWF